jgi:uncharacterized protein involved in exopolysaccharide biosynthesis
VTERPADATPNDRWQADADEVRADRPGIVASLLRYRWIVVAVTLAGALAGYGIAQLLPVRYEAAASLILSDPGDPFVLGGADSSPSSSDRGVYLAKQADIATSSVVLGRALPMLERPPSLNDVRHDVTVAPSKDLASISIRATGSSPKSAATLANAVGAAYEQVTTERVAQNAQQAMTGMEKIKVQLQKQLDASPKSPDGSQTSQQQQLAGQITALQQREQDIATQASVYGSGVDLFERAELPTSPTQPKPILYALLGALLGLLGAGAWAWWAAGRNQPADAARTSGVPLREVPDLQAQPSSTPPRTPRPGVAGERARRRPGNGGMRKIVTPPDP